MREASILVASMGHSCEKSMDLLSQYMTYKVSDACPNDWSLAERLILRECKPLLRRTWVFLFSRKS